VQTTSCKASKATFFCSLPYSTYSSLPPLLINNSRVLDITMSFGFSVGDLIAVLQLANDIRKQFIDAPSQFEAISRE
jgi:hypothetical protein